ncbi:MAG: hypothetical protein Q4A05_07865 [Ruminococcus sp.]|nr:hypothetical protein [Ruminococcus sp.]
MGNRIILLDNAGGETGRYISSSCRLDLTITQERDIPEEARCVLVSEDFAGSDVSELVTELRCGGVPVCIVSFNTSFKAQEQFALSGADDVLILPMYGALIEKRINRLCGDTEAADFSFIDDVSENVGQGSFRVDEADFRKLYEFVRRLLERLEKDAHLVKFSFSSRFGSRIEPEMVNDFTSVVQRCLRKGDISCKSGHSLYVILLGADRDGAEVVAKRLIETFWSVCDDDAYDIDYVIKPINS